MECPIVLTSSGVVSRNCRRGAQREPVCRVKIDGVVADSAAAAAGFTPGDIVVAIDGQQVRNFLAMQNVVATSAGHLLVFQVQRGRDRIELKATPRVATGDQTVAGAGPIGVLGVMRSNEK